MLMLMRKYAGSWIIKTFLGIIVLAFALSWGVNSYNTPSNISIAAKVNGDIITINQLKEEIIRLTNEYYDRFRNKPDNIKEQAFKRLVDRLLLSQTAQERNILVTDIELKNKISSTSAFQRDGQFNFNQYQRLLENNKLSPEIYESILRDSMIQERLFALVNDSIQLTSFELEQATALSFSQVQGVYLLFKLEDYLIEFRVSQDEINTYYHKHKDFYVQPERISLIYLIFPSNAYRDEIKISEDKVIEAYERDRNQYFCTPESIKAQHILIEIKPGASFEEETIAKAEAEKILALWSQDNKIKKKNLSKEITKKSAYIQGNKFEFFNRGKSINPLEELALSLQPGQVGLKRTELGWHVIKVEERCPAKVIPFNEVQEQIRNQLVIEEARVRANIAAELAYKEVVNGTNLSLLAEKFKLTLQQSSLINAIDGLPGLIEGKVLEETIDGLYPGQVAKPISCQEGSLLAVLNERYPKHLSPLEEVKNDIVYAVKIIKAQRKAYKEAINLAGQLAKQIDPLNSLMTNSRIKYTNWLTLEREVLGLSQSFALVEALFLSPDNNSLITKPIAVGNNFAITGVASRRRSQIKNFQFYEEQLRQNLLRQKHQEIYQKFFENIRSKADIKILATF